MAVIVDLQSMVARLIVSPFIDYMHTHGIYPCNSIFASPQYATYVPTCFLLFPPILVCYIVGFIYCPF